MDNLVGGDGRLTDAALDKWVANAEASAETYKQLAAVADRVQVTWSAPDNLVTVTVDASGVMTDLRIADRAVNEHVTTLATHILATMRRAQAGLAARMAEATQSTIGDDQTVANAVLAKYHDKFPEPLPPSAPPQARAVQDLGGSPEQSPPPQRIPRRAPLRPRETDERWNEDGGSILEEVDA